MAPGLDQHRCRGRPQLAWLESILVGLNHGGPVHTLDNSLVQLGAIKPPDARHVLTDAVARLGSARRLHNVVPGSPLVQDEIRGLVPALAQLGTVLASRRDEADHTAAVLVGIALSPPPAASSPPACCCCASRGGWSARAG
jgi:hypothetical protein